MSDDRRYAGMICARSAVNGMAMAPRLPLTWPSPDRQGLSKQLPGLQTCCGRRYRSDWEPRVPAATAAGPCLHQGFPASLHRPASGGAGKRQPGARQRLIAPHPGGRCRLGALIGRDVLGLATRPCPRRPGLQGFWIGLLAWLKETYGLARTDGTRTLALIQLLERSAKTQRG